MLCTKGGKSEEERTTKGFVSLRFPPKQLHYMQYYRSYRSVFYTPRVGDALYCAINVQLFMVPKAFYFTNLLQVISTVHEHATRRGGKLRDILHGDGN